MNLLNNIKFNAKKHSPEILLALGITTGLASLFASAIAGSKTKDIVEPANDKIEAVKADKSKNKKEKKKTLNKIYANTGWKLIKTYTPAIGLYVASVLCYVKSHGIMSERQAAISSMLALSENTLAAYRALVAKKIGAEEEQAIFNNMKKVGDPDGENESDKLNFVKPLNSYSVLFDASCKYAWENIGRANFNFLASTQAEFNKRLRLEGYVLLIDVLKALNVDLNLIDKDLLQASYVVGWIYDKNDKDKIHGDNAVLFGVCDLLGNPIGQGVDLFNNLETDCWLTFNVDGDILTGNRRLLNGSKALTIMDIVK